MSKPVYPNKDDLNKAMTDFVAAAYKSYGTDSFAAGMFQSMLATYVKPSERAWVMQLLQNSSAYNNR